MNIDTINIITLAYIGDAIYEVYIRKKIIAEWGWQMWIWL